MVCINLHFQPVALLSFTLVLVVLVIGGVDDFAADVSYGSYDLRDSTVWLIVFAVSVLVVAAVQRRYTSNETALEASAN